MSIYPIAEMPLKYIAPHTTDTSTCIRPMSITNHTLTWSSWRGQRWDEASRGLSIAVCFVFCDMNLDEDIAELQTEIEDEDKEKRQKPEANFLQEEAANPRAQFDDEERRTPEVPSPVSKTS